MERASSRGTMATRIAPEITHRAIFSFGSHSSVVFSLAMRQWMGLRTSRAQFSLRFVHFCASFYEWVTRIRVNPQIQIAIHHFSSDIFDRSVIDQASSQVR
jgi:hypothetical protein